MRLVGPGMIRSSMADAPLMLSVSGCRGIVGGSLTPGVIVRFAGVVAERARRAAGGAAPTVVLARDGRAGGHAIAMLARGALLAAGCRVIDLDVAMTPTAGVMVRHHRAHGGLVITASHNPGAWNGVKALNENGAALDPADARALIDRFRSIGEPPWSPASEIRQADYDGTATHVHVGHVLARTAEVIPLDEIKSHGFRIVVDSVNASGARAVGLLADALGCELLHINADDSGAFPHDPEPAAENLSSLGSAVRAANAAVGFAQDPDGDRLAVIDGDGGYIGEEYTLVLAASALLERPGVGSGSGSGGGGAVAVNLSTSRMIDDVAARVGARIIRSAVGEANVVAAMEAGGCILGGEGNGGVILPTVVPIRDSISAMALILALMAREGRPIGDIARDLPAYAIEKRKLPASEAVAAALESTVRAVFPDAAIDTQDGVRADFRSDGGMAWVHARPSNTEPVIRLIAEAPTREAARGVLDALERALAGAVNA